MSDYTITLKRCSEVYSTNEVLKWFKDYDVHEYLSIEQSEQILKTDIYGNSFWSPDILAKMIFEHYYLREIAFETPEMFRHYAKVKLQEIMRKISSVNLVCFISL